MEFVILGPTALYVDGQGVQLGAAKQRGLLALLLYYVGEPVQVDSIVDELWDGRGLSECRENLYSLASRTRAALNRVGIRNGLTRVHAGRAYRLDVDPALVDYHRFRRSVAEARVAVEQRHYHPAATLLSEAIGLWRGEPLADLRGSQAEHLRRHMGEALLSAHKLLASTHLWLGSPHSALTVLEPFVRVHELDETLARLWVTALWDVGRYDDARTFLTAFKRRFRKEVRADPDVALPEPAVLNGRIRSRPVSEHPVPRQLPADINDFTGQGALIAELDAMLDARQAGTKAVVVSGMPGAGKTTLAVHWGHARRHRFPDGQLHLNASGHGPSPQVDPYEALGRFLRALGIPDEALPADLDQRRERFNEVLSDRRVLLVLDNVADSEQARQLLPTSDTSVTLITSRNRLRGLTVREGVRSLTVAPLADRESLALLRLIIDGRRAEAEPEAVRALARLAGGLPLAVRIVGEHVVERPMASLADLVEELSGHLLDAEGEDDEEATLRTVFAWSYRALGPPEAAAFRALGLYPGWSIGLDAAAALLRVPPPQAERSLNRLAKAHLVNHDTARRYRFHDLLRRYAADRAHAEETAEHRTEALRALLDWYLRSAANAAAILAPHVAPVPDLPTSDNVEPQVFVSEVEAMRWCEAERANLGAVTRWAAQNGFARHAWQIPGATYEIFDRYGRQDDVLELQHIALAAGREDGHPVGQLASLNNLGAAYFSLHDYASAATTWQECLRLARGLGAADAETACTHNLASALLKLGDPAPAVGLLTTVLETCRATGHAAGEASTLHRLGAASRQLNDVERATSYYLAALAIRQRDGLLRGQATTHGELAALYLETGQGDLAMEQCRQALDIYHRTKDEAARCDTLITMSEVLRERVGPDEAADHAREAISIAEEIADLSRQARGWVVLAHALLASGSPAAAPAACASADEILTRLAGVADPEVGIVRSRVRALRDLMAAWKDI